MAQAGFIKFDPERIGNIALFIERQRGMMSDSLTEIKSRSESLRGVWQSESADEYQKNVAALDKEGAELARMLDAFSKNLYQVAGIYKQGEASAKRAAEALPTEGVFRV